jgi:hypothetical protein
MKASLIETHHIDAYLQGTMSAEERERFRIRLVCDADLYEKVLAQQQVHGYLLQYARKELKKELEAVQQKVFQQSRFEGFRHIIQQIFK